MQYRSSSWSRAWRHAYTKARRHGHARAGVVTRRQVAPTQLYPFRRGKPRYRQRYFLKEAHDSRPVPRGCCADRRPRGQRQVHLRPRPCHAEHSLRRATGEPWQASQNRAMIASIVALPHEACSQPSSQPEHALRHAYTCRMGSGYSPAAHLSLVCSWRRHAQLLSPLCLAGSRPTRQRASTCRVSSTPPVDLLLPLTGAPLAQIMSAARPDQ